MPASPSAPFPQNSRGARESAAPSGTNSPIAQPSIFTDRLTLRPIRIDDAAAVNHFLADKTIASNTCEIPFPYSLDLARQWIAPQSDAWQQGRAAVFGICPQTPEAPLMGAIGIEIESLDERGELGYWVGDVHRGNGYCTEAIIAMIEFGFETLGLNRIYAYHLARNAASERVLEKAGLQREGTLIQHTKKWGKFEDVVAWGIVRQQHQTANRR